MRWLGLAGVVGLVACSPAPRDEDEDDFSPSCDPKSSAPAIVPALEVLGETSKDHYELVTPNMELLRHSGPQGGQHFWIHVRLFSSTESIWSFEAKLVDGAGETVATGHKGFTACEQGWSKEREITVFFEQPYSAVTGTLHVASTTNPELAPIELPISVP
jgi:hypothetical protein